VVDDPHKQTHIATVATAPPTIVDTLLDLTPLAPVPVDPPDLRTAAEQLHADAIIEKLRAWQAVYVKARAPATVTAVFNDWSLYVRWCVLTRTRPLPIDVDDVIAYVEDLIAAGRRRTTIDRRLFSIGTVHDAAGLPNPLRHPDFRLAFDGCIRQLVALDRNQARQAIPLHRDDVDRVLGSLNLARRVHLRDAALIALAADTLCRESELVAATVEQFRPNDLDGTISFDVGRSKANQEAEADFRFVSPETWELITAWRARAGITSGPLFVAISGRKRRQPLDAGGNATVTVPQHMHPHEVARIFRTRAAAAGLSSKAPRITGHSIRIGGANELTRAGEDLRAIADAGGWKGLRQPMHYTKQSRAGLGAQARLHARRRDQQQHESETPE